MKRHILIPTDFSNNAYNALFYATRLFKNESCHFYLLNSFEKETSRLTSRVDIGKSEEVIDELFDKSQEQLTELMHSIVRDTEDYNHTFETVSSSKELIKEINFLIRGMSIDLVIMGTKGRTASLDVLLGSTTVRVIKRIKNAPLLVIPEETSFEPPTKMGFATGFKHPYEEFEINSLKMMANLNKTQIHILHIQEVDKISEDQKANWMHLKNSFEGLEIDTHWIQRGDSKTEVLTDFVFDNHIDMVAMIYYKYSFIKSLFRESIVKKIGLHPGIPFLMIPAST
ncbi:MAG: universal stress protein [Flavobacteriaceae bacterium]|nr:universal stress protein [Flavobacteriaceae bacterium]